MFFLVLFILCITLIVWWFTNNKSDYWKKRNVKQVGSLLLKDFMLGRRSLAEVYKDVYDKCPTEPYVGIFVGTQPALMIRDVENIQAVLAGDFQSFYSRGIPINPNDVLADNVLFINDFCRWKILRQKLSPVFTSLKLKNLFYILDRCGRDFADRIQENPQTFKNPFDALYIFTTSSIASSIFGIDPQIKNTMDSPFIDMSKNVLNPSLRNTIQTGLASIWPRSITLFNIKAFGAYEDFFVGIVREVLENRKSQNDNTRHDFIDICLEMQKQGVMKDATTGYELEPTVEVLAAQAFFFFIAGADTSANTMHFTLLELSNNAHVLKKLHEEIDTVFDSCDENMTYFEIEKLRYLDMVINEALRKYPPIGLIQRKCTRDTHLPVGGVKVEKDSVVIIPIYALHRDEQYYPNPELYDPERFSSENADKIPNFAYIPWGEGNRICLGMRFARLQVKAGLAWLLRRFTLRPQSVTPKTFEPSVFALRAPHIRYEIIARNDAT